MVLGNHWAGRVDRIRDLLVVTEAIDVNHLILDDVVNLTSVGCTSSCHSLDRNALGSRCLTTVDRLLLSSSSISLLSCGMLNINITHVLNLLNALLLHRVNNVTVTHHSIPGSLFSQLKCDSLLNRSEGIESVEELGFGLSGDET